MVNIELKQVGKTFGPNETNPVLKGIDLKISKGEIVAIRGDNGTGKTTLLNLIAGIESTTYGSIGFQGLDNEVLRIGYTQQDYTSSLLPWFDVIENVCLPLRLRGIKRGERRNSAFELLKSIGFNLPLHAYPHQLSGGQRQRVAVARALIHQPHLLLLDEPFANLDAHTSHDLQEVLLALHYERKQTIIFISHNLDQCVYFADRILFLHGRPASIIEQFLIPLPRPRHREVVLTTKYNEIRSSIIAREEAIYAKR